MSDESSTNSKIVLELIKNPLLLAVLGFVGGGGVATSAAVGVDWFGINAIRDDIVEMKTESKRIDGAIDDIEDSYAARISALEREQAEAKEARDDIEDTLGRLDKNMFIICRNLAGATCLPEK